MKIEPRQVSAFLRDPGACRIVLLHGNDDGLIRERTRALTQLVAGSLDDPFLVVELAREGWNRIVAEVAALSMVGGRRVLVVRDATDAVLPWLVEAMKGWGPGFVIVEAVGLGKGKLRSFAESSTECVAVACYPEEGRALSDTITAMFADAGAKAAQDVVEWVSQALGGNRAVLRAEIEKLALFAGPDGEVDLQMAQSCAADHGTAMGDEGVMNVLLGRVGESDRAIELAIADGATGVALMRSALTHLQRLHQAKLRVAAGASPTDAVRSIRPPVFFKATSLWVAALRFWSADALVGAIEEVRRVELACKTTGSRPEALVRKFFQELARFARARQSRAS